MKIVLIHGQNHKGITYDFLHGCYTDFGGSYDLVNKKYYRRITNECKI